MRWLDRLAARCSTALVSVAAVTALLMMLHITADVVSRYVLNAPFPSTIEIVSGYYMVLVSLLPVAFIARDESHISVELFTQRMSARHRERLDWMANALVLVYLLLITWQSAREALRRTLEGEVWQVANGYIPIWPSRWVVPAACSIMAICVAIRLLKRVVAERPGG